METTGPSSRKPNSPPLVDDGPDGERNEALTAYRKGTMTFMGLSIRVVQDVLVPRPETEFLGKAALKFIDEIAARMPGGEPIRAIDICCGSGNLACGLAAACPSLQVWATDLTDACVDLARLNVNELNLHDRVRVVQGDMFASLADQGLEGMTDLVVCNPPYIPSSLLATRTDLRHEPQAAFDGGPYGLSLLMRVVNEAPRFLRPGGGLFLEVGPREEPHAVSLLSRYRKYELIDVIRDSAGVIWGVKGHLVTN